MKKLTVTLALFSLSFVSLSQSIIDFWDFNSITNDATTSTGTTLPVTGTGTISTIGGISSTFASGNSNDPNTTDNSGLNTTTYPATGTADKSAGIQINVPTTGFNNIVIEFYQRLSNTANNTWVLQYTLDNTATTPVWIDATTFTFTPQPTGTGDTWHYRTFDFSAITALNNNANVSFRVVSAFDPVTGNYLASRSTSTYSTSGTSRFDLLTIREKYGTASILAANNVQIVNEDAGAINVPVTFSDANNALAKVKVELSGYSNATQGSDFDWTTTDTLTIPANYNGVTNFQLNITDDVLAERTETVIVKLVPVQNAVVSTSAYYQIIYVKDNDYQAPVANNELNLSLLTSFSNGTSGSNSAEIVAFDSTTNRLYIVNSVGAKLDIINFSNPASPVLISSIDISTYGNINSVAVHNGTVAMAIENTNAQQNGFVVFLDQNGTYINQVTVGAMPDMITFNRDFTKILTANEGEPSSDYSLDPEGSVSIVDLIPGYASLTNSNVTTLGFTQYNSQAAALIAQGVRIFSTSASVAQDLEPEYITVSEDNTKAYVTIQENNAILVIDLTTNTIDTLRALGYSDYTTGNGMDASDQSGQILITSLPVHGAYMPDAIAYSQINGQGYVFTANEGDAREFGAVADAKRINSVSLDSTVFPDQEILKNNKFLGRLNALQYSGDSDGDGDFDEIQVLGGRSFSVWDASTGTLVYDSKDLIEQVIAADPVFGAIFNASNSTGTPTFKNRSDDKGPEPEGVTTAVINDRHYVFLGLERIGGAMVFNVDNPAAPIYVGYYNNRSTTASGPDLGAEGIIHISASASPNGNELLILANEVSSTLSVYQINTCAEVADAVVSAVSDSICQGDSVQLSITGSSANTIQWYNGTTAISGETSNTLNATTTGVYRVFVQNSAIACADTSNSVEITVNPLPQVNAGTDQAICQNESVVLAATGTASAYSWNNSVTDNVSFTPTSTTDYIVTGTDPHGCMDADTVTVTVNSLPVVNAGSDQTVCDGNTVTLSASGAVSYTWTNSVTNDVAFAPTSTASYTVTGTDANGCTNTDLVTVTVDDCAGIDVLTLKASVYPNPANQQLIIELQESNSTLTLTDMQGNLVLKAILNAGVNQLNIESLANGSYLLNLQAENGSKTVKYIVKQ